jgi:DNA-binding NtrC family response regulator
MRNILLCSQEPLLIKEVYGLLRDQGFEVDTVEYIADSVRWFLIKEYGAVILDTRNVGLNALEAVYIMKNVFSETPIFMIGDEQEGKGTYVRDGIYKIDVPVEIDRFIQIFKEIMQKRYSVSFERRSV